MLVMLVTYFVIITRFLRKNNMNNQMTLLMMRLMMMRMMILLMDMETILVSSLMSNWRCKIHNTKNQSDTYFHHICKESKQMI